MKKIHSQNSGTGREGKKDITEIREREGNEKSIPKVRERDSEASILGNDREREFPLTPDFVESLIFWVPGGKLYLQDICYPGSVVS